MNPTTIGLDIAKNVFQAHGVDQNGKVVVRKRLSRAKVLELLANLPPCLIGMEACPGAPLLGAGADEARACGQAHGGPIRQGLCQG